MARRRRQEKFHEKHAWVLLFALSLFIAATAAVGIISGIDRTDFEQSTNLTWDEMRALNPTVSDYVQRVIWLNGAAYLGLGQVLPPSSPVPPIAGESRTPGSPCQYCRWRWQRAPRSSPWRSSDLAVLLRGLHPDSGGGSAAALSQVLLLGGLLLVIPVSSTGIYPCCHSEERSDEESQNLPSGLPSCECLRSFPLLWMR